MAAKNGRTDIVSQGQAMAKSFPRAQIWAFCFFERKANVIYSAINGGDKSIFIEWAWKRCQSDIAYDFSSAVIVRTGAKRVTVLATFDSLSIFIYR